MLGKSQGGAEMCETGELKAGTMALNLPGYGELPTLPRPCPTRVRNPYTTIIPKLGGEPENREEREHIAHIEW